MGNVWDGTKAAAGNSPLDARSYYRPEGRSAGGWDDERRKTAAARFQGRQNSHRCQLQLAVSARCFTYATVRSPDIGSILEIMAVTRARGAGDDPLASGSGKALHSMGAPTQRRVSRPRW